VTFPAYPDADVTVARRSFDVHRRATATRRRMRAGRRERLGRLVREARASLAGYLRQHGA